MMEIKSQRTSLTLTALCVITESEDENLKKKGNSNISFKSDVLLSSLIIGTHFLSERSSGNRLALAIIFSVTRVFRVSKFLTNA